MSRYDLTDFDWRVIEPVLPNKPRGVLVSVIADGERRFLGAAIRCTMARPARAL